MRIDYRVTYVIQMRIFVYNLTRSTLIRAFEHADSKIVGMNSFNPYSTTTYGSSGAAHGGGFDESAGGGFGSPGSAQKVWPAN
jgi:hypothetical protein